MTRRSVLHWTVALFLLAAATTAAPAAEDVLKAIPEGTLTFAVLNRIGETDAKIQKLAGQLQLPVPGALAKLKDAAGVKEGINEQGAAAIVVMPSDGDDAQPAVLLLVPVTDFGKFLGQLKPEDATAKVAKITVFGGPYLAAKRGSYAVLADAGQKALLEKVIASDASAAEELAPLDSWLGTNDLAGVVTRKGMQFYCDLGLRELRKAKTGFADMPAEMKDAMGSMVAVLEMYEKMLEAIRKEVVLTAGGVRLEKTGDVWFSVRMRLLPGGAAARALATVEPPKGDLLAKLPAEPFALAGAGTVPQSLTEAAMQFSMQIMKSGLGPFGMGGADAKKLVEISKEAMEGVQGVSMMMGVGGEKDPLYGRMIIAMQVDDSAAYMERYQKALKAMTELTADGKKSILSEMKVEKTRVGDADGFKITMGIPLPPGMGDAPEVKQMMEQMMDKMYGNGGKMVGYLVPADRQTVVMGYSSTAPVIAAMRTIKQGQKGLAGDPQVAKTAAMLPSDALWVAYWSPQGTVALVTRAIGMFASMGGGAAAVPEVPKFPATPAIGAVVRKAPEELRLEAVAPAEVLKATAAYILKIKQAAGGQ